MDQGDNEDIRRGVCVWTTAAKTARDNHNYNNRKRSSPCLGVDGIDGAIHHLLPNSSSRSSSSDKAPRTTCRTAAEVIIAFAAKTLTYTLWPPRIQSGSTKRFTPIIHKSGTILFKISRICCTSLTYLITFSTFAVSKTQWSPRKMGK